MIADSIAATTNRLRLFNLREVVEHLGHTLMSLAVVAVSATLLVAVFGISGSITGSVDRLVAGIGGNANLEVSGVTDTGFPEAVRLEVAKVAGVAAAVPMLRTSLGPPSERVVLLGVDQNITAMLSDLQRAVQDQIGPLLTAPNTVVVGTGTGHAVGDAFALGNGEVTAAAVVGGADAERINGGNFIVGPLALVQRLTGRIGMIDSVFVIGRPGADLAQLRAAVTDAVAGSAIVADPSFRTVQASGVIALLRATALLSASTALVVAGFLVYIAMSMAISQRRRVISILRAIGGRPRVIVRDLIAEAALLGLIGGALGAVLGGFAGRSAIHQLPPAIVQSVEARIEYLLPGYAIPAAVAACVTASVVASAVAARQVYKVVPIEALAPVGVSQADAPSRVLRVIAAVLAVVAGVSAFAMASADLGRLSIASISVWLLSSISLCFVFTAPIVRCAAAVARLFGSSGMLGATSIERAPRRVWATLMTVMIAVVSMVSITSSNDNVIDAATKSWQSLADANLYVSSTTPDVFPTAPILPEDLERRVAGVPGVERAVPGQITFATLNNTRVMIYGVAAGSPNNMYESVDETQRRQLLAGEGVLLSRDVAKSLAVTAGDEVELPTPHGVKRVRVVEVVPYFSALSGAVAMNLMQLRQWFNRPGSTNLAVTYSPGADPDNVAAAIRRVAPPEVHVYTGHEAIEGVSGSVKSATALSRSIMWIVTFVAAVALLNTLMLSVLERRRELGVLRAIGSSRRFALRMVLAEATGIGLVGGALGLVFGAASQYLNSISLSNVMTIDVVYHASPMMLVFASAAVALSLLGSIPPAVQAARLNIVEAVAVE